MMKKKVIKLPELNISEEEVKFLLAVKLFEEGVISLGKAAELAGYSERTFSELLIKKGIPPLRFEKIEVEKEKDILP